MSRSYFLMTRSSARKWFARGRAPVSQQHVLTSAASAVASAAGCRKDKSGQPTDSWRRASRRPSCEQFRRKSLCVHGSISILSASRERANHLGYHELFVGATRSEPGWPARKSRLHSPRFAFRRVRSQGNPDHQIRARPWARSLRCLQRTPACPVRSAPPRTRRSIS